MTEEEKTVAPVEINKLCRELKVGGEKERNMINIERELTWLFRSHSDFSGHTPKWLMDCLLDEL